MSRAGRREQGEQGSVGRGWKGSAAHKQHRGAPRAVASPRRRPAAAATHLVEARHIVQEDCLPALDVGTQRQVHVLNCRQAGRPSRRRQVGGRVVKHQAPGAGADEWAVAGGWVDATGSRTTMPRPSRWGLSAMRGTLSAVRSTTGRFPLSLQDGCRCRAGGASWRASPVVRAFQPPAFSIHARRHTPGEGEGGHRRSVDVGGWAKAARRTWLPCLSKPYALQLSRALYA